MSKPRDSKALLFDILEASRNIAKFIQGKTFETFENDILVAAGVNYQLMIIGEATKLLPIELRNKYTDVPWKRMAGLRDILIHQYHSADSKETWKIASLDVPELVEKLEKILKETAS